MVSSNNPEEENWSDLAGHLRDKVLKRTSEISYLHTRAGFIVAGSVVGVQVIMSLPKSTNIVYLLAAALAALLSVASLVMAIVSMHKGRSTTPLNPDEMILTLTERGLTRVEFNRWLAKSYALSNTEFNKEYNTKYTQQIVAAALLIGAITIALILKGVTIYG